MITLYKPKWSKRLILLLVFNWLAYVIHMVGRGFTLKWAAVLGIVLCVSVFIFFIAWYIFAILKKHSINHVVFWMGMLALINLDMIVFVPANQYAIMRIICIENGILLLVGLLFTILKNKPKLSMLFATPEGYMTLLFLFNIIVIGMGYLATIAQ